MNYNYSKVEIRICKHLFELRYSFLENIVSKCLENKIPKTRMENIKSNKRDSCV